MIDLCFVSGLLLKVLIEGHGATIDDKVLYRDFCLIFLEFLQARRLPKAELLCKDLHRHNVEKAALDVKTYEEVEHFIGNIMKALLGLRPPRSSRSPCCRILNSLTLALLATLLVLFLVLFSAELYKLPSFFDILD